MSVLRRFIGALLLGLVTLIVAGFATGHLSSVVTNGVSMQPGHDPGDLVVVMRVDRYAIGDVAAYRDPERDEVVLHRIVGGGPAAFELRGDNNESVDVVTPSADELLGRQVVHVPQIGRWIGSPMMFALAAAIAAAVAAWASFAPARRPQHTSVPGSTSVLSPTGKRWSDTSSSADGAYGADDADDADGASGADGVIEPLDTAASPPKARRWRWWHLVLAVCNMAAVAGLVAALAMPPTVVPAPPAPAHVGSLSYRAEVPASDAYPDGVVQTGDSVFARVTDDIDVTFRYEGDPASPATARMRTVIDASGGWTAAYELAPPTDVVAGGAELHALLDLAALRSTLRDVETQTGITLTTVQMRIEALVEPTPSGQANAPASTPYALTMFFRFDDLGLDLAETSVVTPSIAGPVVTSTEPMRDVDDPREVGGVPREARRWLLVSLLVLAAGTAASWPGATPPRSHRGSGSIVATRRVATVDLPQALMRVQLASRDDLDVVAGTAGVPVLEREDGWAAVVTDHAVHWWEPPSIPTSPPRWACADAPRSIPTDGSGQNSSDVGLHDVWALAAPTAPPAAVPPAGAPVETAPVVLVPAEAPSADRTTLTTETGRVADHAAPVPGDLVSLLRDDVMGPRRPLFGVRPATPAPAAPAPVTAPLIASPTRSMDDHATVRTTIDEIVAYLADVADHGGRTNS